MDGAIAVWCGAKRAKAQGGVEDVVSTPARICARGCSVPRERAREVEKQQEQDEDGRRQKRVADGDGLHELRVGPELQDVRERQQAARQRQYHRPQYRPHQRRVTEEEDTDDHRHAGKGHRKVLFLTERGRELLAGDAVGLRRQLAQLHREDGGAQGEGGPVRRVGQDREQRARADEAQAREPRVQDERGGPQPLVAGDWLLAEGGNEQVVRVDAHAGRRVPGAVLRRRVHEQPPRLVVVVGAPVGPSKHPLDHASRHLSSAFSAMLFAPLLRVDLHRHRQTVGRAESPVVALPAPHRSDEAVQARTALVVALVGVVEQRDGVLVHGAVAHRRSTRRRGGTEQRPRRLAHIQGDGETDVPKRQERARRRGV